MAEEVEEDEAMCLDFVFQDWLDPETFTDHGAKEFTFQVKDWVEEVSSVNEVVVRQGTFLHTKKDDQTGAVVWDDAVIMAKFLLKNGLVKSTQKVLDLGSGTGFLGLALAVGVPEATVVVSDRSVMAPLLIENCKNSRNCKFLEHSWGEALSEEMEKLAPFDVILASGCIYHEEANPLLLRSLKVLSNEQTDIYFAIDFRFDVTSKQHADDPYMAPVIDSFFKQAEGFGLQMTHIENLNLPADHMKKSVRLFACKFS